MARDPKQLRKAYEIKIGKDRADKLSDDQIGLLSKFYNQLSESEQSDIDSQILKGYNDTPLHQMAEEFISEKEDMPEDTSASVATAIEEDEDEEDDDDDFEPLGLEELLGDIREEGKKENALTLYKGTRQDDLVDEEIDERILRLLGLEEVFDIDYSTYLTLLKEKMVAARMTDSKLSTEESELLTNEFKRVKGKVGRFSIKKKKVNIGDAPENQAIKADKFLPPSSLTPPETPQIEGAKEKQKTSKDLEYLLQITETLKSIKDILKKQSKVDEDIRETERKRLEKEKREKREKNREKKKATGNFLKKLKGAVPSLGIFDMIKNFITNVLLGKAVFSLLKWISDPENKKKVEAIGNFLKDWWPALTAAFLMFVTPLGSFVRTMVKMLGGLTRFLLSQSVKLLRFAAKNPLVAAAIGTGIAAGALAMRSKDSSEQILEDRGKADASPKEQAEELSKPMNIMETLTRTMLPSLNEQEVEGRSGGGLIGFNGGGMKPMGTDTVPAMLTPGEVVINKPTVDAVGAEPLLALNKQFGGPNANRPKIISEKSYASGGGLINKNNITYASGGGLINKNNITYASGGGTNELKVISGTSFLSGGDPAKSAPQGPKISDADAATLLAIASLEDTDPQGRADVAQSIYNRLYSIDAYGGNYNQSNNTLKSIITAKSEMGAKGGGQYQPTFGNPQDWKNITDKESAAIALMNSEKGRKYGYTMETAMQQILDTEKALSNPDLQQKAREHVEGRTYFLGKSQQQNMQPGDVLRGPDRNFFSMWYDEKTQYGKERANIASPMPQRFISPPAPIIPKSSEAKIKPPAGPKGLIQSLTDEQGMSGFYMKPINAIFGNNSPKDLSIDKNVRPNIPEPPSRSSKTNTINLPPIDMGGDRSSYQETTPFTGSQEPRFPVVLKTSMNTRSKKLDTYGVVR